MATVAAATSADVYAALNGNTSATTQNEAGSADRFLKLLVAQMQNQDPLNPMDNAQVTSQMAQIQTVNGIDSLNTTVKGLNTQFLQMQALQGASLVGRDVSIEGKGMDIESGLGVGGFELPSAADSVKVEVLDKSGRVAGTLQLGALESGRHDFGWDATGVADGAAYTFRVTAKAGSQTLKTTTLERDHVLSVATAKDGTLTLELARNGGVSYSAVKAVN